MKAGEFKFAILAKCKQDNREYWLHREHEFDWPTTSRKYIELESDFDPPGKAPNKVFMFDTEAEAREHFDKFQDHPHYFTRSGEYRVVKLKPKTKIVDDGWHIDESE